MKKAIRRDKIDQERGAHKNITHETKQKGTPILQLFADFKKA